MAIEQIEIEQAPDDDHQVTVTLRGEPTEVVRALVNGLSPAALLALQQALVSEVAARKRAKE